MFDFLSQSKKYQILFSQTKLFWGIIPSVSAEDAVSQCCLENFYSAHCTSVWKYVPAPRALLLFFRSSFFSVAGLILNIFFYFLI